MLQSLNRRPLCCRTKARSCGDHLQTVMEPPVSRAVKKGVSMMSLYSIATTPPGCPCPAGAPSVFAGARWLSSSLLAFAGSPSSATCHVRRDSDRTGEVGLLVSHQFRFWRRASV